MYARSSSVTGASSGIGEAYAERLAADGWNLIVVARRQERHSELVARLTEAHAVTVQAIQADLARSDEVQRVCGEIAAVPVDVLVNNAGLFGAALIASQLTASSPGRLSDRVRNGHA